MSHGQFNIGLPGQEKAKFDTYTGCVAVIEEIHKLSHDGMVFRSGHKVTALADTATFRFHIKVPAINAHMHKILLSVGAGDLDIDIYEDATVTGDGTAIPAVNLNRKSPRTAVTEIFHTPTVSDPGTALGSLWVPPTGAGIGNTQRGLFGLSQGADEWSFKESSSYLVDITNNSGAAIDLQLVLMWYELRYSDSA